MNGTPDFPWTLSKGHTWLECLDGIKTLKSPLNPPDADYMIDSAILDFMQMPDYGAKATEKK